jgi:DNA-binding CsgD family transcriptional regulator
VHGRLAGTLFTSRYTLHPAFRWDAVSRAGSAKFLAVEPNATPSGLSLEILRLAVASPLHSAHYMATLRDATPELRAAQEQLIWRDSPRPEPSPLGEPILQRAGAVIAAPAAAPAQPEANGQYPEARELPAQHGLTNREIEVLSLIARSRSNQEIAEELGISLNTVERHVANIYRKLNIRGRVHATAYALQHGLAPPYGL